MTTRDAGVPVLFEHAADCCGCSACMAVCRSGAISMAPDEEGFSYPHIDVTKCVGCLLCIHVCPIKAWRLR